MTIHREQIRSITIRCESIGSMMLRRFGIWCVLLLIGLSGDSIDGIGRESPWVGIPWGSRYAAMGNAGIGFLGGPEALWTSPAAPTTFDAIWVKYEMGTLVTIPYSMLTIENPLKIEKLRVGLIQCGETDLIETSIRNGHPVETGANFSHQYSQIGISWHDKWGSIGWGVTALSSQETIADARGSGLSLTYGFRYPILIFSQPFSMGMVVKNTSLSPMRWSTGMADISSPVTLWGISWMAPDGRSNVSLDGEWKSPGEVETRMGGELWVSGGLTDKWGVAVRGGIEPRSTDWGIGLHWYGWTIDYVTQMAMDKIMDSDHRITIGWTPGTLSDPPQPAQKKPQLDWDKIFENTRFSQQKQLATQPQSHSRTDMVFRAQLSGTSTGFIITGNATPYLITVQVASGNPQSLSDSIEISCNNGQPVSIYTDRAYAPIIVQVIDISDTLTLTGRLPESITLTVGTELIPVIDGVFRVILPKKYPISMTFLQSN